MDTWSVRCQSCGREYRVKAADEKDAIAKAKAEHDQPDDRGFTAFGCDLGPYMPQAFNLTRPSHPCAPKDW